MVIHKVADVDENFTFAAVKDTHAEVKIIRTLEGNMTVADYSDVAFV